MGSVNTIMSKWVGSGDCIVLAELKIRGLAVLKKMTREAAVRTTTVEEQGALGFDFLVSAVRELI